jgi:hypothetical protein
LRRHILTQRSDPRSSVRIRGKAFGVMPRSTRQFYLATEAFERYPLKTFTDSLQKLKTQKISVISANQW